MRPSVFAIAAATESHRNIRLAKIAAGPSSFTMPDRVLIEIKNGDSTAFLMNAAPTAWPIPEAPPVMTATFPAIFIRRSFFLLPAAIATSSVFHRDKAIVSAALLRLARWQACL